MSYQLNRSLRLLAVMATLAQVGLAPIAHAAENSVVQTLTKDVQLQADGSLRGVVTNDQGKPAANRRVTLSRGTTVVASALTQRDGQFILREVRPGAYELATDKIATPCRVWAKPAAPPIAQAQALLVESPQVVRGQEMSPVRRAVILGGVIVTSGIVGGVIGYNIQDDAS